MLFKLDFDLDSKDPHEDYNTIANNFLKLLNKRTSLKKKMKGNDAAFMNKEFRKTIYTQTRLKHKFIKNPSE